MGTVTFHVYLTETLGFYSDHLEAYGGRISDHVRHHQELVGYKTSRGTS